MNITDVQIQAYTKKVAVIAALVGLWAQYGVASMDPGTPSTPGLPDQTYILYGAQQPPSGALGDYNDYGTYSVYGLDLGSLFPSDGEEVVNGDVVMLEGGNTPNPDRSNWSDVVTFSEGDTFLRLISYEGPVSDAASFWADYTLSDNVVYVEETPGPYTIYTVSNPDITNDVGNAGITITYEITPQVHNAGVVPEPTTLFTGVLLLLPFGASGLRILRRSRDI